MQYRSSVGTLSNPVQAINHSPISCLFRIRCPFEDDAVDVACLPLPIDGVLLPERMEDMIAGILWRIEVTKGPDEGENANQLPGSVRTGWLWHELLTVG